MHYTASAYERINPRVPMALNFYPRTVVPASAASSTYWRRAGRSPAAPDLGDRDRLPDVRQFGAGARLAARRRAYRFLARHGRGRSSSTACRTGRPDNAWLGIARAAARRRPPQARFDALRRAASHDCRASAPRTLGVRALRQFSTRQASPSRTGRRRRSRRRARSRCGAAGVEDAVDEHDVVALGHLERLEAGGSNTSGSRSARTAVAAVEHAALVREAVDALPLDVLGEQARGARSWSPRVEGLDPGSSISLLRSVDPAPSGVSVSTSRSLVANEPTATARSDSSRRLQRAHEALVRGLVRGADAGAGGGLADDRLRRQHADLRPDRLRQDPERLPLGDRLARAAARRSSAPGTKIVYVSPLKALSYDVERNLRAPLQGSAPRSRSACGPATRRRRSARR